MLERLIELCLRNRAIVLLCTVLGIGAGLYALSELPFDAMPDTTPVQVTVNATAPALSPGEVERQLTFPLEQALGGVPGIAELRSVSKFGFSQITVIFDEETDIYRGRQLVAERLQTVELPEAASRPTLGPVATGLGEVFQYVVRSEKRDATELRTIQDWVVRPQLLTVPGVAEVNSWGGRVKQFHVVVKPHALVEYDLTLADLEEALRRNNANVGGGIVQSGGETRLVQGLGLVKSIEDIEGIVVAAVDGVPVRVSDVADVVEDHQIQRGDVTANGEGDAVLGLGFMTMGENSREVTQALDAKLAQAQRSVPDDVELVPVYRRTDLVDKVLRTVRNNLFEGALLVIAVLFMMLGNLRAGLIVALAIPLSMLFAFSAMMKFGIAGSLMSLGAIDFGLVVDSSLIMVENAERRLAEDDSGRSVLAVVRDAVLEVRRPTLFGELIIAIVYLPILTLEGVEGKLFRPMALTVIFALAGSMLLSVTLTPVLASLMLKRRHGPHREPWAARMLKRAYAPVLDWATRHRGIVIGVALLAVANAAFFGSQLGSQFVPRLCEQTIVINTVRLAGVSLEESKRYGTGIERALLANFPDEIENVWSRTGTGEVATDPMGLELTDVFVTLRPRDEWTRASTQDELVAAMQELFEGLPGMRMIYTQPIEMRVNEMLAGIRADVGIKLYGDDLEVLREKGAEIQTIIESIETARDVTTEQITGQPVIEVEIDRVAIARHGVAVADVLAVVEALGTHEVGQVVEGQRRFDLVLRLDDRYREDPTAIASLLVHTADGQRLPLAQLATIRTVEGPSTIQREWGKRRIVVQANVADDDVGGFVDEAREKLEALDLPPGYYIEFGGQFENLERARRRLLFVVPLTLLLVFTLLLMTYGRAVDALRVFTGVPFAAVGGVLALGLRGLPFSISAAVGFIALSGIAVLGDMVLASAVRRLLDEGRDLASAVREAALSRVRPVVMTGLVAALGFVPMALNTGVGAEIQRPLATVIIGGVLTSTLATLVVMPVLFLVVGTRQRSKR